MFCISWQAILFWVLLLHSVVVLEFGYEGLVTQIALVYWRFLGASSCCMRTKKRGGGIGLIYQWMFVNLVITSSGMRSKQKKKLSLCGWHVCMPSHKATLCGKMSKEMPQVVCFPSQDFTANAGKCRATYLLCKKKTLKRGWRRLPLTDICPGCPQRSREWVKWWWECHFNIVIK